MIKDKKAWKIWVEKNNDAYGKACVDTARKVMTYLDEEKEIDVNKMINRADKEANAGGLTGFMAGAVAQMVVRCHSRGEEFKKKWNARYGVKEDVKGVVNPAILTLKT